MATCKVCARSGWFTSIDEFGVCNDCYTKYGPEIDRMCTVFERCRKTILTTKNHKTKLKNIETALATCRDLVPLDRIGLPTLVDLKGTIDSLEFTKRDTMIHEVEQMLGKARQKSIDASTEASKLTGYIATIAKIEEFEGLSEGDGEWTELSRKVRAERDSLALKLKIQKAEVLLAQGKSAKATEILIEGLFMIDNNTTPNEQQLPEQDKIKELLRFIGAEIPLRFDKLPN